MKGSDLAIPIAVVGAVYLISQSDILGGVSDAVGGAGAGVGNAFEGVGAGIGQVGYTTQDVLSVFSAGAEYGENSLRQKTLTSQREYSQEEEVDIASFEQTKDTQAEIQSGVDIYGAEQGALRSNKWESTKTNVQENVLDFVQAGSSIVTFSPFSKVVSWVKSKASSLRKEAPPQTQQSETIQKIISAPTSSGSIRISKSNVQQIIQKASQSFRDSGGIIKPVTPAEARANLGIIEAPSKPWWKIW